MKGLNASSRVDRQKILDLLGNGCFRGLALRAVVHGREPEEGTAAAGLLADLKESCPQLNWAKSK
jgi:hypothetical protein